MWNREGNFFVGEDLQWNPVDTNVVTFKFHLNVAVARSIHFNKRYDGQLFCHFLLSPLEEKNFLDHLEPLSNISSFQIRNLEEIYQLMELLKSYNHATKTEYFSKPLLNDILQIGNYTFTKSLNCKHEVTADQLSSQYINPDKSYDKAIDSAIEQGDLASFRKSLMWGGDINQTNLKDEQPIFQIIMGRGKVGLSPQLWLRFFKYALAYGAKLFTPGPGEVFFSPYEWLLKIPTSLNLLHYAQTLLSPIVKPLQQSSPKVISYKMEKDNDAFSSRIHFNFTNNKKLLLITKRNYKLSATEAEEMRAFFCKTYDSNQGLEAVNAIFEEDLKGQKVVKLAYSDKKLVGMWIYEQILTESKEQDALFVHCIHAIFNDPDLRSTGLAIVLSYADAFARQEDFATFYCIFIYISISYASYKMSDDCLRWPLYQSDKMTELMGKVLLHIYGGSDQFKLFHHLQTCFVQEQALLYLRNPGKPLKKTIQDALYVEEILNLPPHVTPEQSGKAVPVSIPLGKENFSKIASIAASLGINYADFVENVRDCNHHIWPEPKKASKTNLPAKYSINQMSTQTFWKPAENPSDKPQKSSRIANRL